MVHIRVNAADDLPIYRQVMRQIMDAIAGGQLAPGDKLMSHRDLSEKLVIAPLTVKKAYDELEALGYIETVRGRGTFVVARLPRVSAAARNAQVEEDARTMLRHAYLAGLALPDVLKLVRDVDRELTAASPTRIRKL